MALYVDCIECDTEAPLFGDTYDDPLKAIAYILEHAHCRRQES